MGEHLSVPLRDAISSLIEHKMASTWGQLEPAFYFVAGSHLYRTDTSESDIDIYGCHCAPGEDYLLFDQPESRVSMTTTIDTESAQIEFVSNELRSFGEQLASGDFTVVELFYGDDELLQQYPEAMNRLPGILSSHEYPYLPTRYYGMANSLYTEYLSPTADTPSQATIKRYLYSLRGVLAAKYVLTEDRIEPRLNELATSLLEPTDKQHVETLIAARRANKDPADIPDVTTAITEIIHRELAQVSPKDVDDETRKAYRSELEDWMLEVRALTDTR